MSTAAPPRKRVVVIGAGPGGYPAAFRAAALGMNVTLIDPEAHPGGVCLYRGCIPSKALLHAAALLAETKASADWGLSFESPKVDIDKLRAWKDRVVQRQVSGLSQLAKARKVAYVRGMAMFDGPNKLHVSSAGHPARAIEFDYAVIATGSRPAVIPSLDVKSALVMDSTRALELTDVPKSLLVIGGGIIGLELGTVYAGLGTKVTVVEMTEGLLPGVDRDLVQVLEKRLAEEFEAIHVSTRVATLSPLKSQVKAKLRLPSGEEVDQAFGRVLIAVGRRPNSGDLGLETTNVKIDARGFIETDAQRRTGEPHIFAVGDVAGDPMLAHKATHEGHVAAHAIADEPVQFDPAAIPSVVFTDPEIAWCGLTESTAREKRFDVEVARFPWIASGRATILGRNDGITKLMVERRTERVLGVGIAGPNAGELIAEATLAIEMGAVVRDLAATIHPHPTLSETLMEAAEVFHGLSPHYVGGGRKRR